MIEKSDNYLENTFPSLMGLGFNSKCFSISDGIAFELIALFREARKTSHFRMGGNLTP